jgi:hypothetical protein
MGSEEGKRGFSHGESIPEGANGNVVINQEQLG